ncbi:MAG: DUF1501 domain-containing protein, partial [Myxococcota bacterium]|nr:DUF1501 domain-containing protein [Myxococcota bacterium]
MATQFPVRHALASSASDRKFLFVFATGGWDVTKVFATEFANPNIDFEPGAQLGVVGNLSFVDHGDRSATRRFFERFYEKTLIVNGVQVPSVAHDSCRRLMMTGTTNDGSSDWPALLAAKHAEIYPLPHLVLDGPAYPGQFGQVVTRTGTSGQLDALLNGSILEWSDTPVGVSDYRAEEIVDRYLRQRTSAELVGAEAQRKSMLEGFEVSLSRAGQLKAYQHDLNWEGGGFSEQTALAIDALERGLTRCITLDYSEDSWDTHSKGEPVQSSNFQGLFLALESMLDALAVTPGSSGPLSEETVVVVLSEMGRTPQLNAKDGRDHWPYTSAML